MKATSCCPLPPPRQPNTTHQPDQDHHCTTAPMGMTGLRAPAAIKEEVKAVGLVATRTRGRPRRKKDLPGEGGA